MQPPISSLQNSRVKQAVKLRDRRGRDEQQRIIIDGAREIALARQAGLDFDELFVCPALCRTDVARQLASDPALSAKSLEVTAAVFDKLAYGERQEGIIAVAKTPQRELAALQLPPQALVAILEGVEKPGNVGAVLRTADAAGIAALIVVDGGTDLYNPNAIRASLGAIFTVPVYSASSEETLSWLRAKKVPMYAARVDGKQWYYEADYQAGGALILGSEADGLTMAWHADDIAAIKLPMLGQVDSLNVSVTAGVLFYEAQRQRQITASRGR